MAQSNSISIFVKSQVPDFWNRDGEELVNFIKCYYQWLEQFENPVQVSRKLADYKDADLIPEKYFQFMRNEFMKSIPVTLVDDRLLIKNIVDFYRARGTEKAYNMLFRILYGDETVSYYYPGKDILRASDGKWVIERSLKLKLTTSLDKMEDIVVIRGTSSNATARKDKFISYVVNEVQTNELYINNIFGTFEVNESIVNDNTGEQIGFVTELVTYPGGWIGTDGFLSSNKYLQDNFFYQEYSYQIRSSHALSEYESVATQLVHPAGTKLFGAVDMLATADLSSINLSLLSNLDNVGDVAKITISYELLLNERTHLNITDDVEPRTWVTQSGTQSVEKQNSIGFWGSQPAFQTFGNMPAFSTFEDYTVFLSNASTFDMEDWTAIKILDVNNSANTYHFAQKVVNNTVLVLSQPYQFGAANDLHYQISEEPLQNLITNTASLPPPTDNPKPDYLDPYIDPTFGTTITRISGDPGTYLTGSSGSVWGDIVHHQYMKFPVWNADESLMFIETNSGGPATGQSDVIFLDGETYEVAYVHPRPSGWVEGRWDRNDPDRMVYVTNNSLYYYYPRTNVSTLIRSWAGTYKNLYIGSLKGEQSYDNDIFPIKGQRVSDSANIFFPYTISTDTMGTVNDVAARWPTKTMDLGQVSISPLKNYMLVYFDDETAVVLDITGTNIINTWSEVGQPRHHSLGVEGTTEYAYGAMSGGVIIKRKLSDGSQVTINSIPYGYHTSATNYRGGAWIANDYFDDSGDPYVGEEIIIAKDGSAKGRLCHNQRGVNADYDNEPHGSLSPTGKRLVFASTWRGAGNPSRPVSLFVCDFRGFQLPGIG
jgi:hypothetical protein